MNKEQKQKLIAHLSTFSTPNKLEKMEVVMANRTRHVTIILEDIFQEFNASAMLRSAECFGIQDIHLIEKRNKFKATGGIAMGAAKWLDLYRHESLPLCFDALRAKGYKIVATTPHATACPLPELPLDSKIALVFGTEHTGLSAYALENADAYVTIPMYGFTQSFNVSVSTALCLYQITESLKKTPIAWQLNEEEQLDLTLSWLQRSIRGSEVMEKLFNEQENQTQAL